MHSIRELDPTQTPLDPDSAQMPPPLSGTIDDNDEADDERPDENEAPTRQLSDGEKTRDEFRLDEREDDNPK